ncbi:MAG TPA: dTDP-4-dehydrorhamnose reductase [Flavobacteriaceae bacterium]|nr:dTDP-4-dehydrorhamnose reductase [Flavobacteriaceae bacterium]
MNSKANIVITGAGGQLALSFEKIVGSSSDFLFLSKDQLDITDKNAVALFFKENTPKILINTAGYTQVDKAEIESEKAFRINAEGVKNLAESCVEHGCKLIHFSTDYVFDGKANTPYKESDHPNPQTVYGQSKWAGEQAILESGLQEFAIIRTSWLYSEYGHNFYKTMLRLGETHTSLKVVNDQQGCPSYAPDLAQTVLEILPKLNTLTSGIYHFCNHGSTTWYDFVKAIFEEKNIKIDITPIATKDYPTAAQRPLYSVLDTRKIIRTFGIQIPDWRDRLEL